MRTISTNTGFLQNLDKLYHLISSSNIFGIPANKFIFKPDNEITIQTPNNNMMADKEKHYHRTNTHPVAEKQTLFKEKKKVKDFH